MVVIHVYNGEYLYKQGYPVVIAAAHGVQHYLIVDLFVLIQELPSLDYRLAKHQRWTFDKAVMKLAEVPNSEEYAISTVLAWIPSFFTSIQLEKYKATGDPMFAEPKAMNPPLVEQEPFRPAIIRLRLRGLPIQVIDLMARTIRDKSFQDFLIQVRLIEPIIAQEP